MTYELDGFRVACLTANEGVEQIELTVPRDALREAEAVVTLVAPKAGHIQCFNHLAVADRVEVDTPLDQAMDDEFDALLLPGGVVNADRLRLDQAAVSFARRFFDGGKPIAVICHGPWTLIETGGLKGRTLTSWPSLQTDILNAGAEWIDEEVVVCDREVATLVSSRKPDDLPRFCDRLVSVFGRSRPAADTPPRDSPAVGVLEPEDPNPPEPSEPG
jgi:protease I